MSKSEPQPIISRRVYERHPRVQAFTDDEKQVPGKSYEPSPEIKLATINEKLQPAFFKIHYLDKNGNSKVSWRVSDCPKHAIDLVLNSVKPLKIVAVKQFDSRTELVNNLPPGRNIRDIFPPSDLRLAFEFNLLFKTDI